MAGQPSSELYRCERQAFHDSRAKRRPSEEKRHYNALLRQYYRFFIPPGARVLEVGCGIGDTLEAVKPVFGVGLDFSQAALAIARERHPTLRFIDADAEAPGLTEPFDYIILSDLVNDLFDLQPVLENLRALSHARTRLVLNFFNNIWHP